MNGTHQNDTKSKRYHERYSFPVKQIESFSEPFPVLIPGGIKRT
jgi:hypothetical protein